MIEIGAERLVSLKDAAALIPPSRAGRPTNPSTVSRLIQARKLEGIRLGGRWLTSIEALQRYADRETRAALGDEPAPAPSGRMSKRRAAEIERAEREALAIWG
jgi:hypothetical protein